MTLWSGRFEDGPAETMWRFTVEHADRRLLAVDVRGSMAHVAMLERVGLVTAEEAASLQSGLEEISEEAQSGSFVWQDGDEDVHTAVERRLGELVGAVAGKLHTGRSRNDQVALDLCLYLLEAVDARMQQVRQLIGVLVDAAEAVGDVVVPSYTHVQQAQPVPFAHHLLAYGGMLSRDLGRFQDLRRRLDVSPLGAGAGGGSSLPIDPDAVAGALSMAGTFSNSMDAVASRDRAAEFVWCATQAMVHLSRLSEELILWCSSEFGWATFSDAYTTGSSAMPHKKNPDIPELVRGRTASVIGDLTAIVTLQKGLPMTYNRDLQEDKRSVFHADDTLTGALDALAGMIATAEFHPRSPGSWVSALDLAEVLVRRGVPFRQAHEVVGSLVAGLVDAGRTFDDLTGDELTAADARFEAGDLVLLDPVRSVEARRSPGGGSMASVASQIAELRTVSTAE